MNTLAALAIQLTGTWCHADRSSEGSTAFAEGFPLSASKHEDSGYKVRLLQNSKPRIQTRVSGFKRFRVEVLGLKVLSGVGGFEYGRRIGG